MQHRHLALLGNLGDEAHVVFDHNDGMAPAQLVEQFGRTRRFGIGHAGHGFVEQDQLRLLHQ